MSNARQKDLLFFDTGDPGVGKSTFGEALTFAISNLGITSHYIDEFKYFWEWVVAQDENDLSLLKWGEPTAAGRRPVKITDKGYHHAFDYVNVKVAEEFNAHRGVARLQSVEGARRVGGVSYAHYFGYMDRALGRETKFANLEIRVGNRDEHIARVEHRSLINPNAAPVEVVWEYINEGPKHNTPTQDAKLFDRFVINEVLYNDKRAETLEAQQQLAVEAMSGVIAQVARYFNV